MVPCFLDQLRLQATRATRTVLERLGVTVDIALAPICRDQSARPRSGTSGSQPGNCLKSAECGGGNAANESAISAFVVSRKRSIQTLVRSHAMAEQEERTRCQVVQRRGAEEDEPPGPGRDPLADPGADRPALSGPSRNSVYAAGRATTPSPGSGPRRPAMLRIRCYRSVPNSRT